MKSKLSKSILAVALAALTATAAAAWYYVIIKDGNGHVVAILHCDSHGCYEM